MRLNIIFACLVAFAVPSIASADNTTVGNAFSLVPGGTAAETFLNDTATERWYQFTAVQGRSYCAESQGGVPHNPTGAEGNIDTVMEVFQQGGASLGVNDDMAAEPRGATLSRVCWLAPASELNYVKVTRFNASHAFGLRVRIVETTLFSPWYFVGGDYSSYTTLRSTTSTAVTYSIIWRNAAGNIVGSVGGVLPANGNTFVDARTIPGVLPSGSGSVEIVFNGSPFAIVANTTVMSATTGLSFDAPFTQRTPW
jgi:hypothetical protein